MHQFPGLSPVGKNYLARPKRRCRALLVVDVPEQCCGLSLSTLTEEDRQMPAPGQPTLYRPEYVELAHNYCLLGATNETLAEFFGVARRTIQNWIATHTDFADAVYRGRAVADGVIVRALF
jgi:hypothetical protein